MEAMVDVFKERLNKMDTTDLEAVAKHQIPIRKRLQWKLSEHLCTNMGTSI
jgi:hypothetical protein